MRKFLTSLLALFVVSSNAASEPAASLLKPAFQQSRDEKNIDLVLPVLLKSRLFVVTRGKSEKGDYYLLPSPKKDRLCVTVAENLDDLKSVNWPKVAVTGAQLLKELPPDIEIVIVYKDGGDYVSREHLAWYRSMLK